MANKEYEEYLSRIKSQYLGEQNTSYDDYVNNLRAQTSASLEKNYNNYINELNTFSKDIGGLTGRQYENYADYSNAGRRAQSRIAKFREQADSYNNAIKGLSGDNYDPISYNKLTNHLASLSNAVKEIGKVYKRNDPYSKYSANDDWAEMSQFNEEKYKAENTPSNAYNANLYAAVNDDLRGKTYFDSEIEDPAFIDSLQYMTDYQRQVFNYIYSTEGIESAKSFLDELRPTLNEEQRKVRTEQAQEWAGRSDINRVLASLGSVALTPFKGAAYAAQIADLIGDGKIDQNAGYNSANYLSTAMRTGASEGFSNVGNFLYQTGMSIADFLVNAAITGNFSGLSGSAAKVAEWASLGLMGTGAAADTVIESKDAGMSDAAAMALGTIAGAAEVLTERVSIEKLLDPSRIRDGSVKYIIKNMLAEGSEEVGSDIINDVADALVTAISSSEPTKLRRELESGKSWWDILKENLGEAALDFLGGAISGGVMAGSGSGLDYVRQTNTGRNILAGNGDTDYNALYNLAMKMPENSAAYQYAQNFTDQAPEGLNTGDFLTRTANEITNPATASLREQITNSRNVGRLSELTDYELGEMFNGPAAVAEAVQKVRSGEKLTPKLIETIKENEYARQQLQLDEKGQNKASKKNIVKAVNDRTEALVTFDKKNVADYSKALGTVGERVLVQMYEDAAKTMSATDYLEEGVRYYDAAINGEKFSFDKDGTINEVQAKALYEAGLEDIKGGTINAESGRREGVLRSGLQGNDGTSAGVEARAVAEGSGGNQEGQRQARPEPRGPVNVVYSKEWLTTKDLGFKGGDNNRKTLRRVESGESEGMRRFREAAEKRGKKVVYFAGDNLHTTSRGRTVVARGAIDGDTIYVRVDHQAFSAEMIGFHELAHDMINKGEIDVEAAMRDIQASMKPEEFQQLIYDYAMLYRSNFTTDEIWTEIVCDSIGGMNSFALKGNEMRDKYAPVLAGVREAATRTAPTTPVRNTNDTQFSEEIHDLLLENFEEYKNDKENLRIAEEGLRQLTLWDFGLEEGSDLSADSDRANDTGRARDIKVLSNALSKDLVTTGKIDITGREVNSALDLARICQLFRNPRFETFRYVFTNNGKIVGVEAVSSRLPGSSRAFGNKKQWYDIFTKAHRVHADTVYFTHNHPSGDPSPSSADIMLTRSLSNSFQKTGIRFGGHVVTNHKIYSVIDGAGRYESKTLPGKKGADKLLEGENTSGGWIGQTVMGQDDVARIGAEVANSPNYSALIFASNRNKIRSVQEISDKTLINNKEIRGYIRNQARENGSGMVCLYTKNQDVYRALRGLYASGFLTDLMWDDEKSGRYFSAAEMESKIRNGKEFGYGNDDYPVYVNEGTAQYSEEADNTFTQLYTTLPDGRLKINDASDLSTEDWQLIYRAVKKLGYDIRSAQDAKKVYGARAEYGFNKEQSDAIRKAYGLSDGSTASANPKREALARKTFGTTGDFREAGYLMRNGSMLDFSGKKDGGPAHARAMDHREINSVFSDGEIPESKTQYGNMSAYMNAFINEGNIRLMDGQGVTIGEMEPTSQQYQMLSKFIDYVLKDEGYFYLDLSNADGYTIESRDYTPADGTRRIIQDIKSYFKNGELPYKSNLSQFFSEEADSEYMAAVKNGDMETAQKMVEDAAKAAGYTIKAYHGTTERFTEFSRAKQGKNFGDYLEYGAGFYFTPNRVEAEDWAYEGTSPVKGEPVVMSVFLNPGRIIEADSAIPGGAESLRQMGLSQGDAEFIASRTFRFINYLLEDKHFTNTEVQDELKALGYDAIKATYSKWESGKRLIDASGQYVVFDPEQIKSADAVTYDDDGNVIPLSERFDDTNRDIRFSEVTDEELIKELDSGKTVEVYRSMQIHNGELYPPMSAKYQDSDGKWKWKEPLKLNTWYKSDEDPSQITRFVEKDGRTVGKITLNKGNNTQLKDINYNPYNHSTRGPLNDQFTSAYDRPELVLVKALVPDSEVNSENPYWAQYANNPVGEMDWNEGPVSKQLDDMGRPRKVILSQYIKLTQVLTPAEQARAIAEELKDVDIPIPVNTLTPAVRKELEKLGVKLGPPAKNTANKFYRMNPDVKFSEEPDYAPTFYSKLEREVENYKGDKIGASSAVQYLKGRGVKDEEIKWSGINTFLEGKKSVSKQELLDFLRANKLEIAEDILAEDSNYVDNYTGDVYNSTEEMLEKATEELYGIDIDADPEELRFTRDDDYLDVVYRDRILVSARLSDPPRWRDYTMGGFDYREILFRLPDSSYTNQAMNVHWGRPGVVAHARVDNQYTPDDRAVLFVEEIQSDWHNAGAREGYANPDDSRRLEELKAKLEELKERKDDAYLKSNSAFNKATSSAAIFMSGGELFAYNNYKPLAEQLHHKFISNEWSANDLVEALRTFDSESQTRSVEKAFNASREAFEMWRKANDEYGDALNEYNQLRDSVRVPDAPFRDTYTDFVLKNLLRKAAEGNYDYLAWATGEMQEKRWSSEYAEGYRIEYDQQIPSFLRKYGKQWGAKLTEVIIGDDGNTVPAIEITDKMKESVLHVGQPMFSEANEELEDLYERNKELREQVAELRETLRRRTKQKEYWKAQTKTTERPSLREDDVRKIATKIQKSYNSDVDITKDLKELGESMLRDMYNPEISHDDVFARGKEKAEEVAQKLLSGSKELKDFGLGETYKDIRNRLKNSRIYVPENIRGDIPDYEDFRKSMFGSMTLTSDRSGEKIDSLYGELGATYGTYLFPEDITNEADMLTQIADVIHNFKPVYENMTTYDIANAVEYVAEELMERSLAPEIRETDPTYADRMEKRLAEVKAKADRAINRARLQRDRTVNQLKQHYAQVQLDKRTKRQQSADRTKLLKIAKRLTNMKLPAVSREYLNQIIGDLDLISKGITGRTVRRLTDLKEWYDKMRQEDPYYWDDRIEHDIDRLSKRQISSMTQEEVADLTRILLNFENEIRTQNKAIDSQMRHDYYMAGVATVGDINQSAGRRNVFLDKFVVTQTLTPEREVHRITGYFDNDPMYQLTQELSGGQRKAQDYMMRAYSMFTEWTENKALMKKWTGKKAEEISVIGMSMKTGQEEEVKITPAMRISLYLHSKNRDNMRHIINGGINIPDMELYKQGKLTEASDKGTIYKFSYEMLAEISSHMTPEEKAFAAQVSRYFNTMSRNEINATSEDLVGYSIAGVEEYFPIRTDKSFTNEDMEKGTAFDEMQENGYIKNMGFTKERVAASNPIMLFDVTTVLNTSISQHAKYVGLAIPVRNFNRLWNEKGKDDSVRRAIKEKWGREATDYIRKMINDVQIQSYATDEFSKALAKLRSNYAQSVLTLNPAVAIKQSASYPTAAAVVGWQPLIKALADTTKVDINLIAQYTPDYWYRAQGYSTDELGDIVKKGRSIPKLLNWIQAMDLATTRKLWLAAEYYIRDTNKELTVGTKPYYEAVAEVYNRIIEETQPNYATMQRPQVLRSEDSLTRALNMFKTQPFQNFNILYEAAGNYRAKHRQNKALQTEASAKALADAKVSLTRAISSQVVSAFVFALMQYLWDRFRKKDKKYRDDDGELTLLSRIGGLSISGASSVSGMVPFGGAVLEFGEALTDTIVKAAGGDAIFDQAFYGLSESGTSMINDAAQNVIRLVKYVGSSISDGTDAEEILRAVFEYGGAAAQLAGVPANNVINFGTAIVSKAGQGIGLMDGGKYVGEYNALRIIEDPMKHTSDYYDLLYRAYKNDRKQYDEIYKRMIKEGFTEDKIKTNMEKRMKTAEGVKSVEELSERWLTSEAKTRYDSDVAYLERSSLWGQTDADAHDDITSMLYDIAMGSSATAEKKRTQISDAEKAGVSEQEYLLFQLALKAADPDGGNHTNAQLEEAIRSVPGLSDAERDYLWTASSRSSKIPNWR